MTTTTIRNAWKPDFRKLHAAITWITASFAFALMLFHAPLAIADGLKFTPSVNLSETYTDNLRLAQEGAEAADFITEISPGFILTDTHQGAKFKINYQMQNLAYARDNSKITTNHLLSADAQMTLINDLFFVDATAGITQQNLSPFGPQASDNFNLSSNRTEVRTYSISPYLRHRFGGTATSELRYTRDSVATDSASASAAKSDRVLFDVNSGPAFRTVGWGMQYSDQKTHYENGNSLDLASSSGSLRYLVSASLNLTATAGYERDSYVAIGEKPEGKFWSTGFSWVPSERTSISATVGKRYFGRTGTLATSIRSRHTVWSINYGEDVTTSQSQFLVPVAINTSSFYNQIYQTLIPDPVARQQYVDALIASFKLPPSISQPMNILTDQVLLQKSLQTAVAINGARNTLVFNLYDIKRNALSAQSVGTSPTGLTNSSQNDQTKQIGAGALWTIHLSPVTNANISADYTQAISIGTGVRTNTNTMRIALTRQFQTRLRGILAIQRLQQDFSLGSGDIRNNTIMASLLMGL